MSSFQDLNLRHEVLQAIEESNIKGPSEVQRSLIPIGIRSDDALCVAAPGTGKRVAIALIVLQHADPSQQETTSLVVVHSRQLAFQMKAEFARFSSHLPGLRVEVFYGGVPIKKDRECLREPPQIIIGTPGRLHALLRDRSLSLSGLTQVSLVLCDPPLAKKDMRSDVQKLFAEIPQGRQLLIIGEGSVDTDTMSLCHSLMHQPEEVCFEEDEHVIEDQVQAILCPDAVSNKAKREEKQLARSEKRQGR